MTPAIASLQNASVSTSSGSNFNIADHETKQTSVTLVSRFEINVRQHVVSQQGTATGIAIQRLHGHGSRLVIASCPRPSKDRWRRVNAFRALKADRLLGQISKIRGGKRRRSV